MWQWLLLKMCLNPMWFVTPWKGMFLKFFFVTSLVWKHLIPEESTELYNYGRLKPYLLLYNNKTHFLSKERWQVLHIAWAIERINLKMLVSTRWMLFSHLLSYSHISTSFSLSHVLFKFRYWDLIICQHFHCFIISISNLDFTLNVNKEKLKSFK